MQVIDLPDDVLAILFLYLDPKSFLNFCASSKVLHANYQKHPLFWRSITSSTFRTPISPLLKADGARWFSLYRRLKTQTRLYTWGQGLKGNLGRGMGVARGPGRRARVGGRLIAQPPRLVFQRTTSTWPTEAHVPEEVGVIADLQCGGWSTVILSSEGRLFATGSINSANFVNVGTQTDRFERLEYLTQSTSAIAQFSAGRTHILALTDDHEVLSWDRINAKGLKIRTRLGALLTGNSTRVTAGWAESSAYAPDIGIVYWKPIKNDQQDDMHDAKEVNEKVIPNTARKVMKDDSTLEVLAHVVLEHFIVWITSDSKIWACDITHDNDGDAAPRFQAIRLPGYSDDGVQFQDLQGSFRNFVVFTATGQVLAGNQDFIGRCFERATVSRRENYEGNDVSDPANWGNVEDLLSHRPRDVPALQNAGVISVSFGDWHYQALHSNGRITSHGKEPESCGALGLGDPFQGGMLRGQTTGPYGLRQDTALRPVADLKGREVWFEPEKRDWLQHLQKYAVEIFKQNPDEHYWRQILHDPIKQTIFSEWIEQEGRHWEDGPSPSTPTTQPNPGPSQATQKIDTHDTEDFHVDAYFALAIGAAGWHSGALVLVDEEKADAIRQKWIHDPSSSSHPTSTETPQNQKPKPENVLDMPIPGQFHHSNEEEEAKPIWVEQSFPRIQFSDGTESPTPPGLGEGEHTLGSAIRPWRDGMPSMQDLGLELETL